MSQMSRGVKMLGPGLRRMRKLAGFSQDRLADLVRVTPGYISHIETGKRTVSPDVFVRICDALEIKRTDRAILMDEESDLAGAA